MSLGTCTVSRSREEAVAAAGALVPEEPKRRGLLFTACFTSTFPVLFPRTTLSFPFCPAVVEKFEDDEDLLPAVVPGAEERVRPEADFLFLDVLELTRFVFFFLVLLLGLGSFCPLAWFSTSDAARGSSPSDAISWDDAK